MPECRISTVRGLFYETKMSPGDFRIFATNIRSSVADHLDGSGIVSVEKQDPAALRLFLDKVKKSDPTITKKYPYCWPVLAYLELYLHGRWRSHYIRHRYDALPRPRRHIFKVLRVPIWIRFAHSEKTGKSLQEISEMEATKDPRVSRSTPRRTNLRRPVERKKYKKEPPAAEADESTIPAQPVDSPAPSNRITAPVSYFLRSFGSSIEGICSHFVSG